MGISVNWLKLEISNPVQSDTSHHQTKMKISENFWLRNTASPKTINVHFTNEFSFYL